MEGIQLGNLEARPYSGPSLKTDLGEGKAEILNHLQMQNATHQHIADPVASSISIHFKALALTALTLAHEERPVFPLQTPIILMQHSVNIEKSSSR